MSLRSKLQPAVRPPPLSVSKAYSSVPLAVIQPVYRRLGRVIIPGDIKRVSRQTRGDRRKSSEDSDDISDALDLPSISRAVVGVWRE
eukprot:1340225-Amorphochlora_amoeboformis.AAC.1